MLTTSPPTPEFDAPVTRRLAPSAETARSPRGLMETIGLRLASPLFARRSARARLADLERRIGECNSARGVNLPSTRVPRPM